MSTTSEDIKHHFIIISTVVICSRGDVALYPCCSRHHSCRLPISLSPCAALLQSLVVTMSLCFRAVPDVLTVSWYISLSICAALWWSVKSWRCRCFRAVSDIIIVGYLCHNVLASTMVVCEVVTMSLCFRAVPDVITVSWYLLCHHVKHCVSLRFPAVLDVITEGYLCHNVQHRGGV